MSLKSVSNSTLPLFQIRYMAGAMVDVGNGKIQLERLREMLVHPERFSQSQDITVLSPHGLYLTDLKYPESCWIGS